MDIVKKNLYWPVLTFHRPTSLVALSAFFLLLLLKDWLWKSYVSSKRACLIGKMNTLCRFFFVFLFRI